MEADFSSTKCSGCGELLPDNYTEPCPKCGDTQKMHFVSTHDVAHAEESLGWQHIREYYERHAIFLIIVIVITIGSPFLGLVLAGWIGIAIGLVIGIATFFLGLRAVTKVREIREGH